MIIKLSDYFSLQPGLFYVSYLVIMSLLQAL